MLMYLTEYLQIPVPPVTSKPVMQSQIVMTMAQPSRALHGNLLSLSPLHPTQVLLASSTSKAMLFWTDTIQIVHEFRQPPAVIKRTRFCNNVRSCVRPRQLYIDTNCWLLVIASPIGRMWVWKIYYVLWIKLFVSKLLNKIIIRNVQYNNFFKCRHVICDVFIYTNKFNYIYFSWLRIKL